VRIPPARQRIAAARTRKGNAGAWAGRRHLYITPGEEHPSFTAMRTTSKSRRRSPSGIGLGRQDRSAHHRWPQPAQDSARREERPEVPPPREGRPNSRTGQRGDQIGGKSPSRRLSRATERTRNCCVRPSCIRRSARRNLVKYEHVVAANLLQPAFQPVLSTADALDLARTRFNLRSPRFDMAKGKNRKPHN